jgi:hypothetical protein
MAAPLLPLQPLMSPGHQCPRPESTAIGMQRLLVARCGAARRGSGWIAFEPQGRVLREVLRDGKRDSLYEAQHHRPRSRGMPPPPSCPN